MGGDAGGGGHVGGELGGGVCQVAGYAGVARVGAGFSPDRGLVAGDGRERGDQGLVAALGESGSVGMVDEIADVVGAFGVVASEGVN